MRPPALCLLSETFVTVMYGPLAPIDWFTIIIYGGKPTNGGRRPIEGGVRGAVAPAGRPSDGNLHYRDESFAQEA